MSNGWEYSAQPWIESMGDRGDWGREHVLDPVMLARVGAGRYQHALDIGCGEGRFCRMLKSTGVTAIGIDPTVQLLDVARQRDPTQATIGSASPNGSNLNPKALIWSSATSRSSTSWISERRSARWHAC